MKIVLAILISVIAFCFYLLIDAMRVNAKRRRSLRARIAGDGSVYDDVEGPTSINGDPSSQAAALAALMRGFGIKVDDALRGLELRFARAGIPSADGPIYYLFFQRILSFVIGILAIFIILNVGGEYKLAWQAVGVIIAIIAVFGPQLYVQNKIEHRTKDLMRAFPDTLDLLLICVEAGLALDAALNRVCGELTKAYPAMTDELNRTRLELAILNDRVRALTNLGERTGMVAFRSLVVALIQSERFGTSLIDTLRVLSEDFRLQRLSAAETKAARLPVLITIPLMVLLMPAFMIVVLGPAIVKALHM